MCQKCQLCKYSTNTVKQTQIDINWQIKFPIHIRSNFISRFFFEANCNTQNLHNYTYKGQNSYLFNKFVCRLGFFWYEWARLKREWNEGFKSPPVPKRVQFTLERVEYNVFFCSTSPKSRKIFKINLTFRFDKLSHLSKSVHIGENSQILTVSNKKWSFATLLF
jgi:hypothetical protein